MDFEGNLLKERSGDERTSSDEQEVETFLSLASHVAPQETEKGRSPGRNWNDSFVCFREMVGFGGIGPASRGANAPEFSPTEAEAVH